MWVAERDTTRINATDEDRGLAHVYYGQRADRDDARSILLTGIKEEIQHYMDGPSAYFNTKCVTRLVVIMGQLLSNPESNSAEFDGLRFQIRKVRNQGSPATPAPRQAVTDSWTSQPRTTRTPDAKSDSRYLHHRWNSICYGKRYGAVISFGAR